MEEVAEAIGSTPTKVRLAVVGLMAVLLGWVLFFAYMRSGLAMKEVLVQSAGLFWPGTTLLAPALYDMICKAWGRQV